MHVLVPGDWTVTRGHNFCEDLADALIAKVPDLRVEAHLEPAGDPRSYEDIDI
jgi:divalent metal cation (Fe/Co/Zn/Cd) transporter